MAGVGSRIPVVVVSGLPGSGKTWLIESLLHGVPAGSVAVIGRAQGSAAASALYRLGAGPDAAPAGACPCCSLSGELAAALRDLFMAALQRRIAVPRQVLIETAGRGDPAAILYSLHHEAFLRERYFYRGCITAVSARARLDDIGLRQAALADALVLGPASAGEEGQRSALRAALEEMNPLAPCFDADLLPDLAHVLPHDDSAAAASLALAPGGALAKGGTLWSGARAGRLRMQWSVAVLRLAGHCELTQPQFLRAMDQLQDACGTRILRLAAVLRLRGEAGAWELRGVHHQLYWRAAAPEVQAAHLDEPAAPLAAALSGVESSRLLAVLESSAVHEFKRQAESLLKGLRFVAPDTGGPE